jgi:acyl-CoA thioesterase
MPVIAESVQKMLAGDASTAALGIEVLAAGQGTASARLTVASSMANGHGIGHGGIVFALADTAFACAANSVLPGTATADASIAYFSPARVGEVLVAEARVRHRTRRQAFVDVTVRSGDRLVADYRGRGAVLPAPSSSESQTGDR